MATAGNGSKVDDEPPADTGPDKTKDGRPIFRTSHYNKIPVKERGAIRILKVHPGEPEQAEVQCELIPGTILSDKDRLLNEASNLQFKPYDALSWSWGKAPSDAWISILKDETSYVKYVQPGLVTALRALRHGTYARYLWVDAVCINQGYKVEKNVQVEMMAEIYGRADYVRIWLGDSDPSSDLAILFIKQQILQLHHFDDLSSSTDSSDKWRALLELMQRDWFSRRWVIQEVMKTDAKYHHVPRWFEYISQLGASLLVDATGRLFRDYDYIQERPPPTKKSAMNPKTLKKTEDELCYESEDNEVMSPQERADRYKQDHNGEHAKTKGQPLLTLEYLVSSMSIFDVTNPHDSVYALLGIAKDTTPTAVNKRLRVTDHTQAALEMFTVKKQYLVDYQASYIDICKEFIQFCVRQNVSRDPSRALDVICRPWAIEIDVKGGEPDLPSWLPRLSKAAYGMILGPGIDGMRMGRKNADSLVGLPNVTHRNYNAAETKGLDKKTFRFRKREAKPSKPIEGSNSSAQVVQNSGVSTVSRGESPATQANGSLEEPVSPTGIGLNEAAMAHVNGSITQALQEGGVATPQSSEVSLNYVSLHVKGFILDTIASVQPSSQSGSIPTAWARFAGWEQMEGTPPEHFWRTLVADRGSDGKNPPVYYSRACQESFRKGGTTQGVVDTMGLIEHERNSVVAQFCRRVQAAIWNRALIKTEAGRFGLVSNNVKEGDFVCILYGCSVPVVLRRHGPKKRSIMDYEMRLELRHIVDYVVQSYRTHLARREVFRDKREKDKAEYGKWISTKRREWKKDQEWETQWKLVRAGLERIHEFRAWVNKKSAQEATSTMRNYIHILLPQIYEIAAWATTLEDDNGTIIDRLATSTSDGSVPETFKMTSDQMELWKQFSADANWSDEWNAKIKRYRKEEGFRAWSIVHKQKIGYAADKHISERRWKQEPAQRWTEEWATENSWFLCIDPFRAWMREKGKFYGSEEVVQSKQEWENDGEWHSKHAKEEPEIMSFKAWMEAKGRKNSELNIVNNNGEVAQFEHWRRTWRAENPDAELLAEREAWDSEWRKQKADSEKRRLKEIETRKERAEKRDKQPFLERWRKGWCPPAVNWQEFEIALSYGKHWLKLVRRGKREHVNEQEKRWATSHAVEKRQQARRSYLPRQYGYQVLTVNGTEASSSDLQETEQNGSTDADVVRETTESSVTTSPLADSPKHSLGVTDGNTAAVYPHGDEAVSIGPLKRSKTRAEKQEESEKEAWHKEHQILLDEPFVSQDELKDWIKVKKSGYSGLWGPTMQVVDEQHKAWERSTPKFLGKDGRFHNDLGRSKPVNESAEPLPNPPERDERQTVIAAKRARRRYPKGHYFKPKQRARLTQAEQADYMSKVEETFRSRLGDDGQWYYEMLGECYVHGMMDGEAMAHQNDKVIPQTLFEIR
ncbi:MAG: hypothetical protein Q9227_001722 [Pyrenula ochraceoflavens]